MLVNILFRRMVIGLELGEGMGCSEFQHFSI